MLWGWGTKHKSWDLGNGYTLICAYKYFHIWFILRFITSKRWFLQGENRFEDKELTFEQVKKLVPQGMPKISAYSR